MTGTVNCLDQKNECSQQATWKSVMGYFSLVHTLKHELNIVLDENINFDNVVLVFSCLPGQFAGYVTCFFTCCQVRSAARPILSQAIKSACYLSYSFPGQLAVCLILSLAKKVKNAMCLYFFTGLMVSLLHVFIPSLAVRSACYMLFLYLPSDQLPMCLISSLVVK